MPLTRCAAVRTVPRLMFFDPAYSPETLTEIFGYYHLESLAIVWKRSTRILYLPDRCLPKLKQFNLSMYDYGPAILQMLRAVFCPLERFDMSGNILHLREFATFRQDMRHQLSTLKYASFNFTSIPSTPFLDELVLSMPSIETLVCGLETCTSNVLNKVSSTLVSLTLYASTREDFPSDAYADIIERSPPPSLASVVIADTPCYR